MAGVPVSRPKPEHLLMKWAGTVLEKSEDEWTDVDAFKDGRLLLELLDRLWLGGSTGNRAENSQLKVDTPSQDEEGTFQGGIKIAREVQHELTPCVSPRTLAAKGKAAGVNLDVPTLEKVKQGDGAALHETLLSVYRPWIMQNGQKGVRRASKGRVSETVDEKETAVGGESVEASNRALSRGGGLKEKEPDQGGETRAGVHKNVTAGLQGQPKLGVSGGQESGAVTRQQDFERAPDGLEGIRKVESMTGREGGAAEKAVVAVRAEALGASAMNAGLSSGAAYAAPAAAEPSQPGKRARANVLKRLNTKAKAGLVAGQVEKVASAVSAGEILGSAGEKGQSAPLLILIEVDGLQAAESFQKEREGTDLTSVGEKRAVAASSEGAPERLQMKEGESDELSLSSSLLVQDKKVIVSSSPKSETQSGSAKTGLGKATGLEKALVPGTTGENGDGAQWRAALPPRSAYSASDAQLASARAWLADIISGVSADVSGRLGPPIPSEFASGVAHVRACELLLGTNFASELRQLGDGEAVSMTERRVAFVYEQLRLHGVRVSNLRRRKRSSGGAIDGEKLGPETEIELTETLMSAAAELGMSIPRAVERIRELTGVKEHPYDWEDALQLWVNAVLADHHSRTPVRDGNLDEGLLCIDDLLVDLSDGRALTVLLHYLSPTLIDLLGIALDRQLSRSKTVHVIGLVQQAARTILVPFPLTSADLIYGHAGVKPALLYFLAAVFRTFEQREPLLPVVRKEASSKGMKTGSEPGGVRSGESVSGGFPSVETEALTRERPHQTVSPEVPDSCWEVDVPAVSSSPGRPESRRSEVAARRLSSSRPASRTPTSPTAGIPAEAIRSAQDSVSAEAATGGQKGEHRPRSGSVGKRSGSDSPGSQDAGERGAKRSPSGSKMTSTNASRTSSANPSTMTSPDSSRLTSARSFGQSATNPMVSATREVLNSENEGSDFEPGSDVTGHVSALPTASMTSEDARAVRQANLWALLNRAEANAATAAASLSLVRERLSEELSAGVGPERNRHEIPESARMLKREVGTGVGRKREFISARVSAEVGWVGRAEQEVARASSAPVPLADFRFEAGLEDEDMVRIGEPSTVELDSEPSGTSMGGLRMAERKDVANVTGRSPGYMASANGRSPREGVSEVRKRMKKLSLRTHPLEKVEAVGKERLETFGEAAGSQAAGDEGEPEGITEQKEAERNGATAASLNSSRQCFGEADVRSTKSGAGKSAELCPPSLDSPIGSVFKVRDALKTASSPAETRSSNRTDVPRLSLPGEFTSPASPSPRTGRASGRSTGLKSYRSRGSRVLSTERSVEARRSLEAQFRLLEEQKAVSDRKRNEGLEVRKSLEERRAALTRRSQEGIAGFGEGLGVLASGNEGSATGFGGLGSGGGSILRVLSERLSRSTEGSEGDVADGRGEVSGVTSEAAEQTSTGKWGEIVFGSIGSGGEHVAGGNEPSRAGPGESLKDSDGSADKRRSLELPRGTLDVADVSSDVPAPTESSPEARVLKQGSVDPPRLGAQPPRLSVDPLTASAELRNDLSDPRGFSESLKRSADALNNSVENVERGERKEIDWGSLDSDSPVRRTEFPSDSESSGRLGGQFRAERSALQDTKAVDWGTLLTRGGLDVSSDISRLDDSVESKESEFTKAARNGEGSEEQRGSSLWGDEGHVSKWERRWSPESMHADVMQSEAEETETRGGGERLWEHMDVASAGLASNENENGTEPRPLPECHPRKPPKPVALHLIDRDDSEKRARMQRALDEKRAQFLLERQLQQAAAASSRRPTDDGSQNPETFLASGIPSGKRRSSRPSAEGDDGVPVNSCGGLKTKGDSGSSANASRRVSGVSGGAADGDLSGKASRRVSGLSEDCEEKASRRISGVGPFYAAPPRMSNKKLVRNALSTICLAGGALRLERERALMALDAFDGDNFVILFKDDKGTKFKGLYVLSADGKEIDRIYGSGPESLRSDGVAHYFKYDSGAKEFKPLPTQQFTTSTCAVAPSNRVPGKRLSR